MSGSRRAAAWEDLARPVSHRSVFQPDQLTGLPDAAQRFLGATLSPEVPLSPLVLLEMEGEIKLRDWTRFRGRQVLRAGEGFVWEATAGSPPITFKGADTYWKGAGGLDFRLWGVIPVVRASGADVDRSAAGRLAVETVAWAPQSLLPDMGAEWRGVDPDTAVVTVPAGENAFDVTITVDVQGRLRELTTQRWGDPEPGVFDLHTFGGAVDEHTAFAGITIATRGRVGWWWGTERQQEGEFFRFRVTDARFEP